MKKFFLLVVSLGFCLLSNAQSIQKDDPNAGHFDIVKNTSKGLERINVNYTVSPPPCTNSLDLHLTTPDPMMMSVKIYNSAEHVEQTWKPSQVSYTYYHQFDISSMRAGKYIITIYGPDDKKAYSIAFQK